MKALKKSLFLLFSLVFSIVIGSMVGGIFGVSAMAIGGVSFAGSLIPKSEGLKMGIQVEIWHKYIAENLYKNNAFLEKSVDVSDFVINGKIVHIPNAGQPGNVERNRIMLPAKITRRTDIDILYSLDEFTTDPVAILNAETVELSYNKMESVLSNEMSNIRQNMAEWMLYNWRFEGSKNIILTTGDSTPSHLAGTTGNRKKVMLEQLEEAQALMDEQDLPEEDRFALFDARMYQQLTQELTPSDYKDFSAYFDPAKGVVGKLFGFDIMKRSSVLRANGSNIVSSPVAPVATTDKACAIVWQKNAVERAVGEIVAFENPGDPTFYGDIYSFLVRSGGRKRFADGKGVIGIVQTVV